MVCAAGKNLRGGERGVAKSAQKQWPTVAKKNGQKQPNVGRMDQKKVKKPQILGQKDKYGPPRVVQPGLDWKRHLKMVKTPKILLGWNFCD